MPLKLMYITNNPKVALIAEKYGVDRIWVDLEILGKEERQKNMNTVKSHHSVRDIEIISKLLTTSEMLVRINPINENSEKEINAVINAGAQIIMLPMWKSVEEVKEFIKFVCGRAKTTLLLECKEAIECLDDVLLLNGVNEIHIGLNDLHLSYRLSFMFELLSNGTVESICNKIKDKGIPYGFGGIAKLGEGLLPAEKIIMEHYRLGSTRAILSRSFCNTDIITAVGEIDAVFKNNMKLLRDYENEITTYQSLNYLANYQEVIKNIEEISEKMRGNI